MINVNTFKPGITFKINKDIFVVMESQHAQQARGQANVKVKIKNLRTGSITSVTYTGGDRVEPAHIEKRDMDYLYNDGANVVLMDLATFEQVEISMKRLEWELQFMVENTRVIVRTFENEFLDIELPASVALTVTSAPDAVRGNSASSPTKKISLETGIEVDAPMFIKQGEKVLISTQTGKYLGRA